MTFLADADAIISALEEYERNSSAGKGSVIAQEPLGKIIADLNLPHHIRRGGLSGENLRTFIQRYLSTTTNLHHPAYMAHQVGPPHYAGALAALIDGFTNNPMAIYEMGPGAASIEYAVINWLLEKVGWQPAPLDLNAREVREPWAGGVLTHGGSLANLTALIAARKRLVPDIWQKGNPGDLAVLVPETSHYSVARAAGILGIGREAIYPLEVDSRGAVLADRLPDAFERVIRDGKRVMALVSNACSTAVGIYDPLEEIGKFCNRNNIWMHVDGAHGASALLSGRLRHYLKGVKRADSLTWDAHKLLRTPALCTALLVRNHADLDGAFEQKASYLFHDKDQPGFDFIHRTVECTKAGLGLKLFLVAAALGEQGLAEYVERQYDLAMEAYDFINRQKGFACPVMPQSNIVCFRVDGSDELQLKIRNALTARGDFFVSTTEFRGRRYLRMALMNPRTRIEDVRSLIETIRILPAQEG